MHCTSFYNKYNSFHLLMRLCRHRPFRYSLGENKQKTMLDILLGNCAVYDSVNTWCCLITYSATSVCSTYDLDRER